MGNKPFQTLRDGAVKVSIWKNDGEQGPFFTADLTKSYKDGQGRWQDTRSLSETDILKAAHLLGNAYELIKAERAQ